ncbi:MAG TPA: DUF5808 domain-containing protein [Candidatus Baltobacteraceae bacterium]|nr:DUF5808 domain-containing protein [Candidatus Baltobacteraceae bacterium]
MSASNSTFAFAPRQVTMPGGWLLQLGPFAILAATAIYLRLRWDEIPARFPVHWGANGLPNGWSVRTPLGVYWPLLFGACVIAIVAAVAYAALRFGQTPARDSVAHSLAGDFAREIGVFLLALEFFLAVIFSFVGLLPIVANHDPGVLPILIATLAMLAALIFAMSRLAKQHARHAREMHAAAGAPAGGPTPEAHWKAGVFYVNPDDEALFVHKRFGIGYTLNFGHVAAWVLMGLTLIVPIVLALTVLHLSK